MGVALTGLERLLTEISTGRVPDEQRAALARAYRADLGRPIVESGEVPEGLLVPALGDGYVPPLFRACDLIAGHDPSDESWWDGIAVREDLEEFLGGFLTSPCATRAPLLLLGQPGSGKSVLTRVLAIRRTPWSFVTSSMRFPPGRTPVRRPGHRPRSVCVPETHASNDKFAPDSCLPVISAA